MTEIGKLYVVIFVIVSVLPILVAMWCDAGRVNDVSSAKDERLMEISRHCSCLTNRRILREFR